MTPNECDRTYDVKILRVLLNSEKQAVTGFLVELKEYPEDIPEYDRRYGQQLIKFSPTVDGYVYVAAGNNVRVTVRPQLRRGDFRISFRAVLIRPLYHEDDEVDE